MGQLKVGIVGLPNAGKSTLFNALCARRLAQTAPRPFTTIEPHEAVVGAPDENLDKLSSLVKPEKTVPAQVTFIDIAGLVKNAHRGEGLGNQFLAKIREVDALVQVVRAFSDPNVSHQNPNLPLGSQEQISEDIETVNLELEMGEIVEKPTIYVLNVDENTVGGEVTRQLVRTVKKKYGGEVLAFAAKLEEELIDVSQKEKGEWLRMFEVQESGLGRLIKRAYKSLDLITFYTIKGGKEVHAWSLSAGANVLMAAAKVHTDFAQKFIKAEVINVKQLLNSGSWLASKRKGMVKLEGRKYVIRDEDVVEFIIGR